MCNSNLSSLGSTDTTKLVATCEVKTDSIHYKLYVKLWQISSVCSLRFPWLFLCFFFYNEVRSWYLVQMVLGSKNGVTQLWYSVWKETFRNYCKTNCREWWRWFVDYVNGNELTSLCWKLKFADGKKIIRW